MSVAHTGTTSSYQYNGLGDRVRETNNGVTTNFTLDLNTGLTQVLADGTNTYLYGTARIGQFAASDSAYFLGDALGSVRQLVDGAGAVTMSKSYEPYGEVMSIEGSGESMYGYTGEWHDSHMNSVYLRSRHYLVETGRFLTKDTWDGDYQLPMSYNAWLYTYDNPINLVDRNGHFPSRLAVYELDTTTAPTAWTFKEKSSINRSLSAVARAYANAYNSELRWRLMEDCADSHYKYFQKKITPLKAFLTIHGGPITFRRFGNDPDYWGEGYSRNEIYIYSEAEFDNKRFIVHEVGHTFENALDDVLRSGKLGRNGLTEDLWLRAYEGEDYGGFKSGRGSSQFSTDYGVWDDGGTPAVWNEETKRYDFTEDDHKDGRGEIFADMFIGWVYNEWETRVDGTWTTKGQERADYMARNMGDWIYRIIEKARGD